MTIYYLDSRKGPHPINQKKNEYWKQWIEWSLESRMMKGIIYDQTSLSDLPKNALNPQGRHDHHLWPISNQWEWPHETCHCGVRHQPQPEPRPDLTSYVSLRSHSDIPRIWQRYRPLSHHAEGSFGLGQGRVWRRYLSVLSSGSKSAGSGVRPPTPHSHYPYRMFSVRLPVWGTCL